MTTPQNFNVDAWLDDAERPSRSVTVYQKAGIVAELDALEERIVNAEVTEAAAPNELGLGERSESDILRGEYARLVEKFKASALTVRVQSMTDHERSELLKDHEEAPTVDRLAVLMSAAIVEPKMTVDQVSRLHKVLGEAQYAHLVTAWNAACHEMPSVSADFLPKPSTRGDGEE